MLTLTPEVCEAAYEYLRATHPFNRWNMPEGEDVRFRVTRSKKVFASYCWNGEKHEVGMSAASIGHTRTLMEAMAHEMIHMHLEQTGIESYGHDSIHNAAFRKYAKQVCDHHGFDEKSFY